MADSSQDVLDTIPSFADGQPAPASTTPDGAAGVSDKASPDAGGDGTQPGDGQPKSALEAAERVMAKAKEASPASEKPQDGKPQDAKATPDPKAAADANLPFKDHPRWKEVTSELRILRVAKDKNETAIKELEPKAQTYDELSGWLRGEQLSKDDFGAILTIGAAVRNDPFKAYELLQPIMERIETIVGVRLSEDLERMVAAGQMTREAAQATQRARGEAAVYKGRSQELSVRDQQSREERAAQEAQRHAETIVQGIVAHVDSWAQRDPDAERKRPHWERAIELELRKRDMSGTAPRNTEEAAQIIDGIIKAVNDEFRSYAPAPKPKQGILPSGGTTDTAAPVPKSSLEAAQLALSRPGG